jgi:ethanolamine utilization microcompartment shell protein EutS
MTESKSGGTTTAMVKLAQAFADCPQAMTPGIIVAISEMIGADNAVKVLSMALGFLDRQGHDVAMGAT